MLPIALAVAACADESVCDATEALPVVSVDVVAFSETYDLDAIGVCMDGQCVRPGEPTEPLLFGRDTDARFLITEDLAAVPPDDAPTVTLLVRTDAGEQLVPETTVALTLVRPQGEECGGEAWQGWFAATADGTLIDDPAA